MSKTKKNHLQNAVIKLKTDLKSLVSEREIWSREKKRGFSLLRSNTQTGHWEFVQGEIAIVFNSGLKTAANEIVVWKEGQKLSCHDVSDLKLMDASLRKLKRSLKKLPIRHRIKGKRKTEKNKVPTIPSIFVSEENPFYRLHEKLINGIEIGGITLTEFGYSSKGSPFMIVEFNGYGTMIWIKEESAPYWYNTHGNDASLQELSQMKFMLSELERTTEERFIA